MPLDAPSSFFLLFFSSVTFESRNAFASCIMMNRTGRMRERDDDADAAGDSIVTLSRKRKWEMMRKKRLRLHDQSASLLPPPASDGCCIVNRKEKDERKKIVMVMKSLKEKKENCRLHLKSIGFHSKGLRRRWEEGVRERRGKKKITEREGDDDDELYSVLL